MMIKAEKELLIRAAALMERGRVADLCSAIEFADFNNPERTLDLQERIIEFYDMSNYTFCFWDPYGGFSYDYDDPRGRHERVMALLFFAEIGDIPHKA